MRICIAYVFFIFSIFSAHAEDFSCPNPSKAIDVSNLFEAIDLSTVGLSEIERKANAGEPYYQFSLARLYERGDYAPKNDERSVYWYKKALNNGFGPAGYNLGLMFIQRNNDSDAVSAFYFFREGCEQGSSAACYNAANMTGQGKGSSRDVALSKEFFECAAILGEIRAYTNLGLIELKVENNKDAALDHFFTGAKKGDAEAMYQAGSLIFLESSSRQESEKGLRLIVEAAKKGNPKAKGFLEHIK